jgi:PilZ domain
MTTPPVVERRIGQRFTFNLPVSLRDTSTAIEGMGFTQDLSSRGAFLFTDMVLGEGTEIELTLKMPSEITLGASMRVRCRGRVLRVTYPTEGWGTAASLETRPAETRTAETTSAETRSAETRAAETKIGVAVCLKEYEYLPENEDGPSDFQRISALHSTAESERAPVPPALASPRATGD